MGKVEKKVPARFRLCICHDLFVLMYGHVINLARSRSLWLRVAGRDLFLSICTLLANPGLPVLI